MAVITDRRMAVDPHGRGEAERWTADLTEAGDYYAFGGKVVDRQYNPQGEAYRYGFNGQQTSEGVHIGSYTALYWEYNSRIGRRWNVDPKPNIAMSPYAALGNNPVWISDPLGDSSVINGKGGVVYHDPKDKDKRVFAQLGGKLVLVGKLGGKIKIDVIYRNLVIENVNIAKDIFNPLTFQDYVRTRGVWDYKSDSKSIFGIGNDGKTKFIFEGNEMEPHDVGNHHFGIIAKAYGLFPSQEFILREAGSYQIKSGTSRPEWQQVRRVIRNQVIGRGVIQQVVDVVRLPPYGDDPRDQHYIKAGFEYYKTKL